MVTTLQRTVQWRDLVQYQHWEILKELSLPLPWLVLELVCIGQGWYAAGMLAAFYFFLTGLRVTHNAFHYAVGLSRRATDAVMFGLSLLMFGSLHAVQVTHLRHHRYCLSERDVEGSVARQGLWETLLKGPQFPLRLHQDAWRHANPRQKHWIRAELLGNVIILALIWSWSDSAALQGHSLLMLAAYSFSAFFAVWTVHHDCDHDGWNSARTLRSPWKSLLFYNMFFHIEHHLFPAVPTCHLPELARRLDKAGYKEHHWVI